MPLAPATRLGPYEILALIGAGGMGEVYQAHDTRLNRDVAVKVSAAEFNERFEREAQAIAALNHPNICRLYDVGPNYLVMELIEGTPLKGPLPVGQALRYAAQICGALDAAHKKGIIHRDLKPANILVTKTGIKLLDFGLAKFGSTEQAAKPPSDATLTMALTGKNEIVGTLYYMSPEQLQARATGQEIDARSDIFSFGLVLYEMLTGKRAFEGASPASVVAAIMERPAPSISTIAPAALDRLLGRCLAKDPDDRWQSARDLKAELEWIESASGESPAAGAVNKSRLGYLGWIVAGVAILIASGLGAIAYRATRPAELRPLVRLDVDLGSGVSLTEPNGADTILSPDGTRLVFVSKGKLFTRKLDQPKAVELAGTDGVSSPFFSPDGRWVAFFEQGKVKKIPVEGGAIIALCEAGTLRGGSWGEDGNIILSLRNIAPLSRVPATGGEPAAVTELAHGETSHRWPQVLPGSKAVLFTVATGNNYDAANIDVVTLADHRRKTLIRGGMWGRYLATSREWGHLVYVNRGTMFAVPFDPYALEVHGTPTPVVDQVTYSTANGSTQFAFAEADNGPGTLVYRSGGATGAELFTVRWLDSTGKTQPLLAKPDSYIYPRLSPDGQKLAISTTDAWVYEARRDTMTRLTFSGAAYPVWSPDGRFIVYSKQGEGMFWTRADGAGNPQSLTQSKNAQIPWRFTADGRRLVFNEQSNTNGWDLSTVPMENDGARLRAGKPEPFLETQFNEREPSFSPDGRWIAYASDESGVYQVYVRAFPDTGGKWQVSSNGGAYPVFSPNGRELFFRSPDSRMIFVASYTANGDSFAAEKPRVWSNTPLADTQFAGANYDVAPDGKRIAALFPVESRETEQPQSHVIFLENFFDELRRKVPATAK